MAVSVPNTFAGRKQMEREACKIAQREFERLGWKLVSLALERSEFIALDSILSLPVVPPQIVFLLALPDCIAYNEGTEQALCVELKATVRPTFSIRCRDLLALEAWCCLLVVVNLSSREIRAGFIRELPPPEAIFIPREPENVWDSIAVDAMLKRYPDASVIAGCPVSSGSKSPFVVWKLEYLQDLRVVLERVDL